jgi:hypothetical protein
MLARDRAGQLTSTNLFPGRTASSPSTCEHHMFRHFSHVVADRPENRHMDTSSCWSRLSVVPHSPISLPGRTCSPSCTYSRTHSCVCTTAHLNGSPARPHVCRPSVSLSTMVSHPNHVPTQHATRLVLVHAHPLPPIARRTPRPALHSRLATLLTLLLQCCVISLQC